MSTEINEYYGVSSTPTEDYLAHYGVRGMKWGVRKAIARGNEKALARQYQKAQKKLAKLEKQSNNISKYKKRAITMGVGAAAAGGLAAAGTGGVSKFMKENAKYAGKATRGLGGAMVKGGQFASKVTGGKIGGKAVQAGYAMQSRGIKNANAVYNAGTALNTWGNSDSITRKIAAKYGKMSAGKGAMTNTVARDRAYNALGGASNNTIARIGAGALGLGLAAGAARNAYKAKTAEKRAKQFRAEMNKAFAGTKYANAPRTSSKKRRR